MISRVAILPHRSPFKGCELHVWSLATLLELFLHNGAGFFLLNSNVVFLFVVNKGNWLSSTRVQKKTSGPCAMQRDKIGLLGAEAASFLAINMGYARKTSLHVAASCIA